MKRWIGSLLVTGIAAVSLSGEAQAAGGNYLFDGGSAKQQQTVRQALAASSFNWSLVPGRVTIHIAPGHDSEALPGEIWLDANLLDAGRFAWGVVQHEYAHQVDFQLLDEAERQALAAKLGGRSWFQTDGTIGHGELASERFASTLAWSYWQADDNSMKPQTKKDESAAAAPAEFQTLLQSLLGPAAAPAVKAPAKAPAR